MSAEQLVDEMRTEVGRLARDEISFLAFRIWFNEADRRAHYGAPSGLADPVAMAVADEIITILFDLDDGFIQGDEVIDALHAAVTKSQDEVHVAGQDSVARHLVRRPA